MPPAIQINDLTNLAAEAGLKVLGITDLSPLDKAEKSLKQWQLSGYAGEMRYMQREPCLLTSPRKLLDAHTAIVLAIRYDSSAAPICRTGFGRVARYAWGEDYHKVLRQRIARLVERLQEHLGCKFSSRYFSDAVPLLERAIAQRAKLGFIGKNTMLIRPGIGSFFFLAEILCDLEVLGLTPPASLRVQTTNENAGRCGSCTRCINNCPTAAFVTEYQLDARRCISYLTIEKRGILTHAEREALGEWVFGCDICQETCPFNHSAIKRPLAPDLEEFSRDRGVGPLLDLSKVIGMHSEATYKARFNSTALMRSGREGLIRNAIIVAANTSATPLTPAIVSALNDSSPVVRATALWGLYKLSNDDRSAFRKAWEHACRDPEPLVRNECVSLEKYI